MPIDYRHYPADWKERRIRILDRAGYCCEHCGVDNYSVIWRGEGHDYDLAGVGDTFQDARQIRNEAWRKHDRRPIIVILTVAHLDHDEWNEEVSDERLAALCQRCHLRHDRRDNELRKRYGKFYRKDQLLLPV